MCKIHVARIFLIIVLVCNAGRSGASIVPHGRVCWRSCWPLPAWWWPPSNKCCAFRVVARPRCSLRALPCTWSCSLLVLNWNMCLPWCEAGLILFCRMATLQHKYDTVFYCLATMHCIDCTVCNCKLGWVLTKKRPSAWRGLAQVALLHSMQCSLTKTSLLGYINVYLHFNFCRFCFCFPFFGCKGDRFEIIVFIWALHGDCVHIAQTSLFPRATQKSSLFIRVSGR